MNWRVRHKRIRSTLYQTKVTSDRNMRGSHWNTSYPMQTVANWAAQDVCGLVHSDTRGNVDRAAGRFAED